MKASLGNFLNREEQWGAIIGTLVVIAHICVTYIFSYTSDSDLPPYYRYVTLLLIATGVWFGVKNISETKVIRFDPILVCYLSWLGWCYVETLLNPVSAEGRAIYASLLKISIVAFSYYFIIRSVGQYKMALVGYVVAIVLFGIYNYDSLLGMSADLGYERYAGSAKNPNTLAIIGVTSLWATISLFFMTGKLHAKVLFSCVGVFTYGLVIYTGSRKGLLGVPLLLALMYYYVIRKLPTSRNRKVLMKCVGLVILCAGIAGIVRSGFWERVKNLQDIRSEKSSFERYEMASAGGRMLVDYPILGVGFDEFKSRAGEYGAKQWSYSHSTLIEVFACTGLVGGFLYFGFYYFLFRKFFRGLRTRQWHQAIVLWGGGVVILFVILFVNMFSVAFGSKILIPLCFMMVAVSRNVGAIGPYR